MTESEAKTILSGPLRMGDLLAIEAKRFLIHLEEARAAVRACRHCKGSGEYEGELVECDECGGSGEADEDGLVECGSCDGDGYVDETGTCPWCLAEFGDEIIDEFMRAE